MYLETTKSKLHWPRPSHVRDQSVLRLLGIETESRLRQVERKDQNQCKIGLNRYQGTVIKSKQPKSSCQPFSQRLVFREGGRVRGELLVGLDVWDRDKTKWKWIRDKDKTKKLYEIVLRPVSRPRTVYITNVRFILEADYWIHEKKGFSSFIHSCLDLWSTINVCRRSPTRNK